MKDPARCGGALGGSPRFTQESEWSALLISYSCGGLLGISFFRFFLKDVFECFTYMYVYVLYMCLRGQRRCRIPPEPELGVVVNHRVGAGS